MYNTHQLALFKFATARTQDLVVIMTFSEETSDNDIIDSAHENDIYSVPSQA